MILKWSTVCHGHVPFGCVSWGIPAFGCKGLLEMGLCFRRDQSRWPSFVQVSFLGRVSMEWLTDKLSHQLLLANSKYCPFP